MQPQLEREISETIENFEPRVQLRDVTAEGFPDENGYKVEIVFFYKQPRPSYSRFLFRESKINGRSPKSNRT